MDCIIPSGNIRVINKALLALARIADELFIECNPDSLSFAAINMNKTLFAKYTFQSMFFTTYAVEGAEEKFTCRIYMKSLLNIFKPKMEKKVDMCRLELEPNGTKMVARVRYKDDVTVVHYLRLIDTEFLDINYSPDDMQNTVVASGHYFNQVLSNFQVSDMDMSVDVENDKLITRNYDTSLDTVYRGLRTQVTLARGEFIKYSVKKPTNIMMSLKPFRTAVSFAEHFNLNLAMDFNEGGGYLCGVEKGSSGISIVNLPTTQIFVSTLLIDWYEQKKGLETITSSLAPWWWRKPLILSMSYTTFNVDYVLSTAGPDGWSQPSLESEKSNKSKTIVTNATNGDVTVEDMEAIASVDWNDDDVDMEDGGERIRCSFTDVLKSMANERKNSDGSPDAKRAKVFGRCFDPTFHASMIDFGEDLAPNSDPDDDD